MKKEQLIRANAILNEIELREYELQKIDTASLDDYGDDQVVYVSGSPSLLHGPAFMFGITKKTVLSEISKVKDIKKSEIARLRKEFEAL